MRPVFNFSSEEGVVDTDSIFNGVLYFFNPTPVSLSLTKHAQEYVANSFPDGCRLEGDSDAELTDFISKAEVAKRGFTNCDTTKQLLEELIRFRYAGIKTKDIFYDVPRLRIIPASAILNSGISYNYMPHRDTWYGAGQEQVNHWISVDNVTKDSTFYLSPSYFARQIANNSEIFDLDKWDSTHRKDAKQSMRKEERPHPIPLEEIPETSRIAVVMSEGHEVCFSGHHLHGSLPNTTKTVRISIDFRVSIPDLIQNAPRNIDSRAKGDYHKYMIRLPSKN
tara:strand:- start:1238 stop:2077 length:840 start_codon:yes stop_codon:yes gene_type:complete